MMTHAEALAEIARLAGAALAELPSNVSTLAGRGRLIQIEALAIISGSRRDSNPTEIRISPAQEANLREAD